MFGEQRLLGAYRDLAGSGVDADHIKRNGRSDTEALALADREFVHAPVFAKRCTRLVHDGALRERRSRSILLNEGGVVVIRNEADLLALRFIGRRHVQALGDLPDLGLVKMSDREDRGGKLLLGEAKEEVGLILVGVFAAQKPETAGRGILILKGVVARGDVIDAEGASSRKKGVELHVGVAVGAGQGSPTLGIVLHERLDDALAESVLEVQDVVRHAELRGHALRVVQVVERAAPPERGSMALRRIMELHRDPDHVVALLLEQGGRDTRIDASGHGYNNAHGPEFIGRRRFELLYFPGLQAPKSLFARQPDRVRTFGPRAALFPDNGKEIP